MINLSDEGRKGWLEGQVAIVTGGSGGIGKAIVDRFISEGAKVCIFDLAVSGNGKVRENVLSVRGDVSSYKDNLACVDETVSHFGRLDIFVGNAGIYDGSVTLVDLPEDRMDQAFDEVFSINVKGYLLGAKAALPHLVRSRGSMIFTVSNSGFYTGGGGPIYTASKHAVVGLIRELAFELAPVVRVNGVAPSGTVTNLRGPKAFGQDAAPFFDPGTSWDERITGSKPLAIFPSAVDHTGAYLLLASRENSSTMTGEIIRSDGGLGVRGLNAVSGGTKLSELFDSNAEDG
jgi:NAD(P)-dependent dehydrogenase (short-subunit alcohol dehydrogenase family)